MRIFGLCIICSLSGVFGCGQHCEQSDLDGTYLVHAVERPNGTCGAFTDFVVQVHNGEQVASSDCTVDYERVSEDACTTERALTCPEGAGYESVGVGKITQEPGGETVSGILSVTVNDLANNTIACVSTYDLTYRRQ